MSEVDKGVNPKLWHTCAGGMGGAWTGTATLVLYKVVGVRYLADYENDEVYANICCISLINRDEEVDDGSDANNGGEFSVPRMFGNEYVTAAGLTVIGHM
ncbi:hypothetical protein Tco_0651488 [Tanacetum coccineum]|uniref:Uncharacterized protein n=1 Tax=Tanacetum coccineum TaxID=301880 RepID=A0ABQ4WV03_9ASTR